MYKQALNDEHRYAIQEWIDEDCGITLHALKNKLLEKYEKMIKHFEKMIKHFEKSD